MRARFNPILLTLTVLMLIGGFSLPASAHQADQTKADGATKKGDDLYKAGKYHDAIDAYKQALAADASNDHALNYIGLCYNKLGDRPSAREWMRRRADMPGQSASIKSRALQDLALLYWDEADLRLARLAAAASDKPNPDETQLITKLIAEGADSAVKAIAIAPKSAKAYSLLNLLIRCAASMETDEARRKELLGKADAALAQSIQFYEASPQQQQSGDMFVAPMISASSAAGNSAFKLCEATKKDVPDSLKNPKGIVVAVEVFVGRDGKVNMVRPVSSSGALGDAAVAAINHWEFQPSSYNGHPVQTVEVVTFPEK
ncbi:MAG TPA: tetratricopeptide repeat protein [Blastocatellia bacterium]|nr:tetratricopeptide repeat protein [Blastocatellia bacterium]